MTSTEFGELVNDCNYNCKSAYCKINSFRKQYPLLSTTVTIGSVVTVASIVSPKVRKITVPLFKYATKQQVKLLAGIGVLSIANYIADDK